MSVYYVHAPELGLVKIGFAANPLLRLGKIRADSPTRLVLLATEDGGRGVEEQRHMQFARHRKNGEWFAFEGALADFVGELPPFIHPRRRRKNGATDLGQRAGISKAYASQILTGQKASIEVLLHVFNATGWKHPRFRECDEATLRLLAQQFPFRKAAA